MMPLFAPVCPPRIYSKLFTTPRSRGMYFLLLAHDVLNASESDSYAKLFQNRTYPAHVHLDNSVIELGDSVSMDTLWRAADVVNANTIVLPDALEKSQETYELTMKGFEDFYVLKANNKVPVQYPRDFMIIPQGETFKQWVRCLEKLSQSIGAANIPWVGIPRNITGRIDETRRNAIEAAQLLTPRSMIHLMGFSDNVFDDFRCCFMNRVAGIDSAAPMRFKDKFEVTGDCGKRGNWWEECKATDQMVNNVLAVRDMLGDHSGFADEQAFQQAVNQVLEAQQRSIASNSSTANNNDQPQSLPRAKDGSIIQ